MTGFDLIMLTCMLLVIGLGITAMIDAGIFNPVASENALQECIGRGFDYADGYERVPFSTKPLGIQCKHAIDVVVDIDQMPGDVK